MNTAGKPIRDPRTFAIIGAAMEVHQALGCGFLEAVYQEALAVELASRGIPFRREVELPVFYKGQPLATHYRADFICQDQIVVEIKALDKLTNIELSQVLNYLKATGFDTGLLINFGAESLEYKRYVHSSASKSAQSAKSADCFSSQETP